MLDWKVNLYAIVVLTDFFSCRPFKKIEISACALTEYSPDCAFLCPDDAVRMFFFGKHICVAYAS